MAVWLYKDGSSTKVNGVYCDAELFPAELVGGALQGEWRVTPEAPEAPEEVEKEDGSEETLSELLDKSANEDIRDIAETEGIDNYANVQIATLKKKLIEKAEHE